METNSIFFILILGSLTAMPLMSVSKKKQGEVIFYNTNVTIMSLRFIDNDTYIPKTYFAKPRSAAKAVWVVQFPRWPRKVRIVLETKEKIYEWNMPAKTEFGDIIPFDNDFNELAVIQDTFTMEPTLSLIGEWPESAGHLIIPLYRSYLKAGKK